MGLGLSRFHRMRWSRASTWRSMMFSRHLFKVNAPYWILSFESHLTVNKVIFVVIDVVLCFAIFRPFHNSENENLILSLGQNTAIRNEQRFAAPCEQYY